MRKIARLRQKAEHCRSIAAAVGDKDLPLAEQMTAMAEEFEAIADADEDPTRLPAPLDD